MTDNQDQVIRVSTGSLIEMNIQSEVLKNAGITSRIVGDDLTAGLGSVRPGTVELWVLNADAKRAEAVLEADRQHVEEKDPQKFQKPVSDAKPGHQGHGPRERHIKQP